MDNSLKQKISVVERAKKLEKIRKSLGKTPITAEELQKAYEESTDIQEVEISVHISSCNVCVGKINTLKTSELSEEEREFIKGAGNCSKYEMFPKAQLKLNNILTKIHQKKEICSLSGSNLMNKTLFIETFLPYLKEMEKELEEVKESIEEDFDDRLIEFENILNDIVVKLFPDKTEHVKKQIEFIKKRGAKGYTSRIFIEMKTTYDGESINREDLRQFLETMKKNATDKFAGEILYSLLDDLWQACITYAVNISSGRYKDTSDLSGFLSTRNNLKKEAIKVRGNAVPIKDKVLDIISLTEKVEDLSLCTDGFEAPDLCFDTLVEIYMTARENYGYLLSFGNKTKTGAIIPSWLRIEEIESTADEIIKLSKSSSL